MNRQIALSTLGLDSSATEDDIKKQFRKLAKEKHPDRGGDENEYKKISEAFEYLKNNSKEDENQSFRNSPFRRVNDFFNGQDIFNIWQNSVQNTQAPPQPIIINLELSFQESVLGCQKKIEVNRRVKCIECLGDGSKPSSDACSVCNGRGQITNTNGNMTVVMTCSACRGASVKREVCVKCKGLAGSEETSSFDIKLRGGLTSDKFVRLAGAGHYFKIMGTDQFGEVLLNIKVKPEKDMQLSGQDVISTIKITLLEALKGTNKKVNTIIGETDLIINPKIKHKDQIKLPKLGVEKIGNHIFTIEIDYPKNVESIIDVLENQESKNV
jgi:molecular chaperone DnaJ